MAGMDFLISALLNAAGLDQEQIKSVAAKLASDDTVNKVLAFSAGLERQNQLLEEIRDELRERNKDKKVQDEYYCIDCGICHTGDCNFEPDPNIGSNRPDGTTGELIDYVSGPMFAATGTDRWS